jgi:hypothetical protein
MLESVKKFVSKHKYKILVGLGMFAVGYWAYDCLTDDSQIKLSHFIEALRGNHIKEVVVRGSVIDFRGSGPEWFRTFIGRFPRQELYKLIQYFFSQLGSRSWCFRSRRRQYPGS